MVMVVVVKVVDVIVTVVVVVKTHLRLMVPVPVGTVPGNELQSAKQADMNKYCEFVQMEHNDLNCPLLQEMQFDPHVQGDPIFVPFIVCKLVQVTGV